MPDRTRQQRVLTVALEVFGALRVPQDVNERGGSVGGHLPAGSVFVLWNKGWLFRAAVRKELDTALGNASSCLDEEGAALSQWVVAALDAWLGRYVGSMLAAGISGLLRNPAGQIVDMVTAAIATFDARLGKAIAAATAKRDRPRLGVTPEGIAAALHLVGQGARYLSTFGRESRAEFIVRLTPAVRLILAGLDATPSA